MYQISFSGGISSAVTALLAHELGLDFNLIFADTLIEDEDLYRFNTDVASAVGKEVIHLKDGRTPWGVFVDKRWIGNTRTAHCSEELKSKPIREWLEQNAAPNDPLVLGFDLSEMDRLERRQGTWAPRPVISLLVDHKIHRPHYADWLSRYGLTKPRLYGEGYTHNNCGGFCVKAGQVQFERLYRMNPSRYAHHEAEMERVMAEIGPTAKPFLRKSYQGEIQYLTLRDFREELESGTAELPMFEDGGACDCF